MACRKSKTFLMLGPCSLLFGLLMYVSWLDEIRLRHQAPPFGATLEQSRKRDTTTPVNEPSEAYGERTRDTLHEGFTSSLGRVKKWLPRANNTMVNYFTKRPNTTDSKSNYKEGVLVFLHLNKAAGSSTKSCLRRLSSKNGRRMGPVLDSSGRVSLDKKMSTSASRSVRYDMLMGGYSFGICDSVKDRECSYFTFARDPYERLLSSYSYCRRAGMDQTCRGLSPWEVSLKEWALSQGSYFFKQLLMQPWFCTVNERSHPQFQDLRSIPHSKKSTLSNLPCWFREKVILNRSLTLDQQDTLLNYCVEHLEDWFAVIGLTSEYDLSLSLLERAYGIPFLKTCSTVKTNANDYKNMEAEHATNKSLMIWELQKDSQVYEALRADIVLYQKAVEIFNRQKNVFLNT